MEKQITEILKSHLQLMRITKDGKPIGGIDSRDLEVVAKEIASLQLSKERVIKAIDDEPELPGDMPDIIYESVKNDKDALTELLRITVRETKDGIKKRIASELTESEGKEELSGKYTGYTEKNTEGGEWYSQEPIIKSEPKSDLTEYYKKVYIKSESDLPKEEGEYIVSSNHDKAVEFFFPDNPYDISDWVEDIDWYLQPISQPEPTTMTYIMLDGIRIKVPVRISRTQLLRLAGITREMEEKAIETIKSAGTGWQVWRRIIGNTPDEQLGENEIIDLADNRYSSLYFDRTFFTGCNNTNGG